MFQGYSEAYDKSLGKRIRGLIAANATVRRNGSCQMWVDKDDRRVLFG
jgi:hypothetical protein